LSGDHDGGEVCGYVAVRGKEYAVAWRAEGVGREEQGTSCSKLETMMVTTVNKSTPSLYVCLEPLSDPCSVQSPVIPSPVSPSREKFEFRLDSAASYDVEILV
jgi:hypothetical protein